MPSPEKQKAGHVYFDVEAKAELGRLTFVDVFDVDTFSTVKLDLAGFPQPLTAPSGRSAVMVVRYCTDH